LLCPGVAMALFSTPPIASADTPASAPVVDPAKLSEHVEALATTFSPRDWRHPENLDRAADYIRQALEEAGGAVRDQPFEVRGKTYRNVIASFGPASGPVVVVGAHYDTAGPLPGADDNASGVAGLLELGRLLGASPPKVRVELVAYTLEEPPFFRTDRMGSAVHAEALKAAGVEVRAMISLEMLGCYSDAPRSQS